MSAYHATARLLLCRSHTDELNRNRLRLRLYRFGASAAARASKPAAWVIAAIDWAHAYQRKHHADTARLGAAIRCHSNRRRMLLLHHNDRLSHKHSILRSHWLRHQIICSFYAVDSCRRLIRARQLNPGTQQSTRGAEAVEGPKKRHAHRGHRAENGPLPHQHSVVEFQA